MMIVEYIRYQLKDHDANELVEAYERAQAQLRDAPECISYELTQCAEDDNSLILRICWESADAHMKGFRTGPNFPPFLTAIRAFISEIAEIRHYRLTSVVSPTL